MKTVLLSALAALAGTAVLATDVSQPKLEDLKWVARPIVVFADSPADPRVVQQLAAFEDRVADLEERDVVILVDTDPSADSALRDKFHPRDFQVVVLGKDGQVKYRKSDPVTVREVVRLIDRMPLRRQELEAEKGQHGL